jgi:LmbE family N-acetylglucosaminyl deacetylase
LEDDDLLNIRKSVPEIKKILHNCLKNKRYKYIFTHGAKGEYGHPRHKAVHRAVKQMVLNKKLAAEKVFFFKYKAKGEFMGKMFRKNFKKKLGIISGIYNFNNGSDEYRFASYLPEKVSLLK